MAADLIHKNDVLQVVRELFKDERLTLRSHPRSEQFIIGNKLAVIEIELKKQIKNLTVENGQKLITDEEEEKNNRKSAERS